jgi:CRISPR-associated endonuclease/helicase Cas3
MRSYNNVPSPFAHSRPEEPPEHWQPLHEHLENVARMAKGFAEPFASGDWAWNAGWLHDVGKAGEGF